MFQTNTFNNTRLALEKCKQDLEALYEDKVEGIILRARVHGTNTVKKIANIS